ncbi:MAG: hypothetical protein RLN60_04040 [Phycisphaerales bacterium]
MQHATIKSATGEIVMPESEAQCFELFAGERLVSLGAISRDAGFEHPMLITPEAVHALAGGDTHALHGDIVNAFHDGLLAIRVASRRCRPVDGFVVDRCTSDGEAVQFLIRQNLESAQPFTLVTLKNGPE